MKTLAFIIATCASLLMLTGVSGPAAAQPLCLSVPEVSAEQSALNSFWGTSVSLCQLTNEQNNARAYRAYGVVAADRDWLIEVSRTRGPWAVTGIMAHEWGHMIQGNVSGTAAELQADCLAGAFMRGYGLSQATVSQFASANLLAGDAEFSFGGHGTGAQRATAALRGYYGFSGQTGAYLLALCPLSAF